LLVGNKLDLASEPLIDTSIPMVTPSSVSSTGTHRLNGAASSTSLSTLNAADSAGTARGVSLGSQQKATIAPEGREVTSTEASRWASTVGIPVVMEASAFTGDNVDEIFGRLARMILTKIELGEIDPDDPMSGIQYGDGYGGGWNAGGSDGASIKSSMTGATVEDGGRRRRNKNRRTTNWGLREWEEVFTLSHRRRGGNCC
jgi:hypothetical protein